MARVVLFFAVLFMCYFWGIQGVRMLNGLERLALVKIVLYSMACTVLTVITMSLFVLTF